MSKRALTDRALTDAEVFALLDDAQTLTLTLLGEARGEEIEGRIAVACVVRNRVRDDRWPETAKDVCLQKMQFSCWQPIGGAGNHAAVMRLARGMLNGAPQTSGFVSESIVRETRWITDGVLSGVVRDRTSGANHYCVRRLWETAPPSWARGQSPTCLVGHHAFFRL